MSTDVTHLHAMRDLVDRQIIDVDELLVGKIDDCELQPDGAQARVAGMLCGAGALAPRLGGRLGKHFEDLVRRLSAPQWEPQLVTLDLLCRTSHGFKLTVPRDYLHATARRVRNRSERLDDDIAAIDRLRLSDLVGAMVHTSDGAPIATVGDARVRVDGPAVGAVITGMTVDGLIIRLGSIGDRLGFRLPHGPKRPHALNRVFRAIGRDARVVPWRAIRRIEARAIYIEGDADGLERLPESQS